MKRTTVDTIYVFPRPGSRCQGVLVAGTIVVPCAIGRGGRRRDKREGDGGTPVGTFGLGLAFYRDDTMARPRTLLPLIPIRAHHGWCEDPGDRRYNRLIRLPSTAGHETMRRDDRLYDVVVEIACNRRPRIAGRGSAIFLHLARDGFTPTAGCVAVAPSAIRKVIGVIGPRTHIRIA